MSEGHAKFAPSAADRWLKCGYTIKMQDFYPDTSNAAADEGTRQHDIAAKHLLTCTDSPDKKMQLYLDTVRKQEGELYVERKVIIVPDLCEGTSDVVILNPPYHLVIGDLKWGKSVVHATDNPQEKLYALGALREFPMPRYSKVTLLIVQPNATSGFPVKVWDTTVEHVIQFKDKVMRAIDEGLKPNPKAVAGSHCFWCPAKIHCKAYLIHTGKK